MLNILVYRPGRGHLYGPPVEEGLRRRGIDAKVVALDVADEVAAALVAAEVLLAWDWPTGLGGVAPRLRWIQSIGAGVDGLLGDPTIPQRVAITRVIGHFGRGIAEYALAHLLAYEQGLRRAYAQQAQHSWEQWSPGHLFGRRLGIAGAGDIGRTIARRARALDLEAYGWRRGTEPSPDFDRTFGGDRLDEFLSALDYLVITLPLTPQTRHRFGLGEFLRLKPGAFVVNAGRGAVVDANGLLEALRSGHLGGAALDVFEDEPLPVDSPLWEAPNLTITPHVSGLSDPTFVAEFFCDNVRRYLDRRPMLGVVDRRAGY